MDNWILTILVLSPLVGIVALMFPRRDDAVTIRRIALGGSVLTLLIAIWAVASFYGSPLNEDSFALRAAVPWLAGSGIDIAWRVGVDGISIWMIALSALLMPIAIWSSFTGIRERTREYYILLLLLQVGLLGVFCALDLLLFYVFFEFTLVPLYFLIAIWGGRDRRRAANKFFIYTLAGSVLTFAGVVFLAWYGWRVGGTNTLTLNIETLTALGQSGKLPVNVQWWVFLAFAAGFAIKVPLFPVHTWLPLAHTEAPTAGSVILAGVLLKLGTYGFCRLSLPMLPQASFELAGVVAVLAIIGIIYAALAAWAQRDVKKLIAYSSVSHLGFCMLGLFSLKVAGVSGAVLYMVNHGLSTGALFLVIGCIYERYHTRDIHEIGGLARSMPWMAFFLVFFTLSSIGLPGLNGFVGEFLVLLGTATSNTMKDGLPAGPLGYGYVIPAALGIILGAVYMLWMCRRVLFGPLKEPADTPDTSTGLTKDLTRREIGMLVPLALACVVLGVYPAPVTRVFDEAVNRNILAGVRLSAEAVKYRDGSIDTGEAALVNNDKGPLPGGRGTDQVACPSGGFIDQSNGATTALLRKTVPPQAGRGIDQVTEGEWKWFGLRPLPHGRGSERDARSSHNSIDQTSSTITALLRKTVPPQAGRGTDRVADSAARIDFWNSQVTAAVAEVVP